MLLFTHGFSLDMSVWHEQWIDLADDFRCVLMDHRSHGASGGAALGDLSVRAMGRDIAAVLDAVAPERPAVVVGHSMGAMAIIAMAEQRPEVFGTRVAGVALIGASSSDLFRRAMGSVAGILGPRSIGRVRAAARRVDRLRRVVLASPADVGGVFARMTQFGPEAQPHLVDHVVGLAGRARPEVWTDGLAGLMEMDLRHALPRVRVPAIVIVGQHDRVTPPATAVELVGMLARRHARRGRARGTHGDARASRRGEPRHPRVRPEVFRGRRTGSAGQRPSEASPQGRLRRRRRRARRRSAATKKDVP